MSLLLLLICLGGNVSEGDGALDRLAREDSLIAPVDEDSDVAEAVGHGDGPQRKAGAGRRPGRGRADISNSALRLALPEEHRTAGPRSSDGRARENGDGRVRLRWQRHGVELIRGRWSCCLSIQALEQSTGGRAAANQRRPPRLLQVPGSFAPLTGACLHWQARMCVYLLLGPTCLGALECSCFDV